MLFGPNYDKKETKISDRIRKLKEKERDCDSVLKKMQDSSVDISWYSFDCNKQNIPQVILFNPQEISAISSMKDLQLRREAEERERIASLKHEIDKCFETIEYLLDSEDVEQAENLLYEISPTIGSLKDDSYHIIFNEYLNKIPALKEIILEKEKRRREKEEEDRINEERRKKEEERRRLAKEKEEEERKRREAKEYEEKLRRNEEKLHLERERLKSLTTRKKENAEEILTYLRLKGVRYFYHFTDENNIMSIRKMGGLYSWFYCQNNDIN